MPAAKEKTNGIPAWAAKMLKGHDKMLKGHDKMLKGHDKMLREIRQELKDIRQDVRYTKDLVEDHERWLREHNLNFKSLKSRKLL